jgi:hypothetical protein
LFNKKISNNPNTNKINGILFPENSMPIPKTHITIVVKIYLAPLLFFNVKAVQSIEKKANLCIKPPAINSSSKNPELFKSRLSKPIILKPKIY